MISSCPFCHRDEGVLYSNTNALRSGGLRDVYRCNECGLLYPHPRMDEGESLDYLNRFYQNLEKENATSLKQFIKDKAILKWLLPRGSMLNMSLLAKRFFKKGGNALDIGTFAGHFCYALQSAGFTTYGLEPYDKAAGFARANGLKVYTGAFPDDIPHDLEKIKYSIISIMECICYMTDLRKSFMKIYDMLDDNGVFLLKCHQAQSSFYQDKSRSFFKRYGDNLELIPEMDSMKYCLKNAGFNVIYTSGSISPAAAPFNFTGSNFNRYFKKVLTGAELLLNKIYDSLFLDIKHADQIIILAKKRATFGEGHE